MLLCRRFILSYSSLSSRQVTSSLIQRYSSSSTDISNILREHSMHFEQKASTTIAYETFLQAPSEFIANTFVSIHDNVGLPWWATIILATITFRAAVGVTTTLSQQRFIERLQIVRRNVTNELEPRIKFINMQAMQGKTATVIDEQKSLRQAAMQLTKRGYIEQNVHPGKLFILAIFGSIPWLYFTFGIRMICMSPITMSTISTEGILWFQNLAVADPCGILPFIFLIPSLTAISFNAIERQDLATRRFVTAGRIQRGITRAVVIGFSIIAFKLPAGIVLFWTLNSSLQLCQTILFELPKVRRMLGLQPSRFGPRPIHYRWTIWKNKWSLFFRTLKWYSKL